MPISALTNLTVDVLQKLGFCAWEDYRMRRFLLPQADLEPRDSDGMYACIIVQCTWNLTSSRSSDNEHQDLPARKARGAF